MRILYVGEGWLGSCARSLQEALARHSTLEVDEIQEDLFFPRHRVKWLRAIHRLLYPAYRRELYREVIARVDALRPDLLITYKGHALGSDIIRQIQERGILTVNVYPDCSPHAHGRRHKDAVGQYDLVISTKLFHRALWKSVYGYTNGCNFVPQGYDPALHLVPTLPLHQLYDVVLVATWRPEYGNLMRRLANLLEGHCLKVAIGGNGWSQRRSEFPADWIFVGELHGHSYIRWLRSGKICIAPVTREVSINDVRQPGDEDTTRTYELAAASCFFIHTRTPYVQTLYDEEQEVPMYGTPEELAEKIIHYLNRPDERINMANRAHKRAVPAYSIDSRVDAIVQILGRLSVPIDTVA
jgi:spore maturation protein CgeB